MSHNIKLLTTVITSASLQAFLQRRTKTLVILSIYFQSRPNSGLQPGQVGCQPHPEPYSEERVPVT
jgi:hypothetical protein